MDLSKIAEAKLPDILPSVPYQHFWLLPMWIGADYLLGRFVGFKGYTHRSPFDWLLGKGTMGRWGLALVLVGHFIDDCGTAIGFQATEEPQGAFEGGAQARKDIANVMKNGLASTETDAVRFFYLVNLGSHLLFYYLGWYSSFTRYLMYSGAVLKAYAGYGWWSIKPNKFGILDLFFGQSRPTPRRCDKEKWDALQQAALDRLFRPPRNFMDERRRLVEADSELPYAWQLLLVVLP